jgi:hypothetical protein
MKLLSNKMTINFEVFRPLVKNGISCNVEGTLIVAIKNRRLNARNSQILEQIDKPLQLTGCKRESSIFCLR